MREFDTPRIVSRTEAKRKRVSDRKSKDWEIVKKQTLLRSTQNKKLLIDMIEYFFYSSQVKQSWLNSKSFWKRKQDRKMQNRIAYIKLSCLRPSPETKKNWHAYIKYVDFWYIKTELIKSFSPHLTLWFIT